MIASSAIDGIGGVDHRIVDRGIDQVDSGLEINQMDPGMSLSVKANQDFPLDIGVTAFSPPTADLNPPSALEAFGYSLRQDPLPNTQIDFSEVLRKKGISEQHRLANSGNKVARYVAAETQQLRTCLYTNWDPSSAQKMVESLTLAWNSFEAIHAQYVPGINERKRLHEVGARFESLKETMTMLIEECEK